MTMSVYHSMELAKKRREFS